MYIELETHRFSCKIFTVSLSGSLAELFTFILKILIKTVPISSPARSIQLRASSNNFGKNIQEKYLQSYNYFYINNMVNKEGYLLTTQYLI